MKLGEPMTNDIYDGFGLTPRPGMTEAEERLSPAFGALDYATESDDYFRESLVLLRTITNRRADIVARLTSYLRYVKDESYSKSKLGPVVLIRKMFAACEDFWGAWR
jgi:hypothetical protein